MRCQDFDGLDVARFDVELSSLERALLPPYLGSTLRGAFGHALKDAVCEVEHGDCRRCPLLHRCIYPYLFETPIPPGIRELRGQTHAPLPFIIEPPLVKNPVRRVWRVGSSQVTAGRRAAASRSDASSSDGDTSRLGEFARSEVRNPQFTIRNSQSAITDPQFQIGDSQSEIRNPKSAIITSVVFPDQPKKFNVGDELSFGLTLIGRAIELLPYVVYAMSEMARRGLGANRAVFELKEVWLKGSGGKRARIYCGESAALTAPSRLSRPLGELIGERLSELNREEGPKKSSVVSQSLEEAIAEALSESSRSSLTPRSSPYAADSSPSAASQPLAPSPCCLRLRFLTPARIRVEGDLQTGLSFQLLVRNLLRRVSMLAAVHGGSRMELDYRGLIERAGSVRISQSSLRWWDLERFSNRQGGKMRLGGVIGEVEYEGKAIAEFLPLLVAGELLRVGTGSSFGLGGYRIVTCA